MKKLAERFLKHRFLFEELVKRDFKTKYKGTFLGMGWSMLSPLLQLWVMVIVFKELYGKTEPHFTIYLFCGVLVFSYFTEATKSGMKSLRSNAGIISKINVPKYLFLLSKNVAALINFGLTIIVLFIFCIFDGIQFDWGFFLLLYPIATLIVFNLGCGMVLSAMDIFFQDTTYLYDVFTHLLRYLSAVFYYVERFPADKRNLFYLNPIYCYITYFRSIILHNTVPDVKLHLLCAGYALIMLAWGAWMYKKYNHKFLYYV